jgi:hypothetical protein
MARLFCNLKLNLKHWAAGRLVRQESGTAQLIQHITDREANHGKYDQRPARDIEQTTFTLDEISEMLIRFLSLPDSLEQTGRWGRSKHGDLQIRPPRSMSLGSIVIGIPGARPQVPMEMRDYLKKKNPGSYDAYTLEKDIYPILKYLGIGQGHPNFPILLELAAETIRQLEEHSSVAAGCDGQGRYVGRLTVRRLS